MGKKCKRLLVCAILFLLLLILVFNMLSKDWFCNVEFSKTIDPISILEIIISSSIAIYLGRTIAKKLSEERFDKEYIIRDLTTLDETLSKFVQYIQRSNSLDINTCSDMIEDIRIGISKYKSSLDIFGITSIDVQTIDHLFLTLYKQGTSQVGQTILGADAPKDHIINICQQIAKEIRRAVKLVNKS